MLYWLVSSNLLMVRSSDECHRTLLTISQHWCRQATSHYLNQCWPRSPTPYDVTRPQWWWYRPIISVMIYVYMVAVNVKVLHAFRWGSESDISKATYPSWLIISTLELKAGITRNKNVNIQLCHEPHKRHTIGLFKNQFKFHELKHNTWLRRQHSAKCVENCRKYYSVVEM